MPLPVSDEERDRIRRMAGGTAVRNISDEDAIDAIEAAYDQVQELSGIDKYNTTDNAEVREKAVRLYAAADMGSRFADMEPQVRLWLEQANAICTSLAVPDAADVSDSDVQIQPTEDALYVRDWRSGDPTAIRKRVVVLSQGCIVGHLGII
jgi:hypothetical protein